MRNNLASVPNIQQIRLSIVDNIQRAIESGEYSCGIFLDFAKAFDTMDHGILLKKDGNIWHKESCEGLFPIVSK